MGYSDNEFDPVTYVHYCKECGSLLKSIPNIKGDIDKICPKCDKQNSLRKKIND